MRSPKRAPMSAQVARRTYRDFVIVARRLDPRRVGVSVEASPAGRLDELVPVVFTEKESSALRDGFLTSSSGTKIEGGRMLITSSEASAIGKRLAEILFPKDVFRLFVTSSPP